MSLKHHLEENKNAVKAANARIPFPLQTIPVLAEHSITVDASRTHVMYGLKIALM